MPAIYRSAIIPLALQMLYRLEIASLAQHEAAVVEDRRAALLQTLICEIAPVAGRARFLDFENKIRAIKDPSFDGTCSFLTEKDTYS